MVRRIAFASCALGLGIAVGCGPTPKDEPATPTPEPVAVQPAPTPVAAVPAPEPQPPAPLPLPPSFDFPSDAGGQKVAAALKSPVPASPTAPVSATPKPRSSDLDRGELSFAKVDPSSPKAPLPAAKPPRVSPPPEAIPADLGRGTAENPASVKLLEKPPVRSAGPVNAGAADVPPLARSIPDRAATDDPTAEIAAQRAVLTPLPAPLLSVWFLRFSIPDPFEFAEQLKGKTGTDQELGTAPVVVPPGR